MDTAKAKTLQEVIRYFSDEQICIDAVARMRWPDGPVCPACGHKEHYYLKTQRRWKCKECYKQFSVKLGTIFEDSPLGLDKWLCAMWLLGNCKNGISSCELARDLGITQKSAWFMLHRIRKAMQDGSLVKVGGSGSEVEVDETFIGGKARNMHLDKRERRITGTGWKRQNGSHGNFGARREGSRSCGAKPSQGRSARESERARCLWDCTLHRCAQVVRRSDARVRAQSHRSRGGLC